jgi:predicted RNA polymerase sigma factor
MTTVQLTYLAASALLLGAAFIVVAFRKKLHPGRASRMQETNTLPGLGPLEERLTAQFKAQTAILNEQNKKMAKIATQVSTLADERLVEQAISIARMGGNPEHISTAVGLSLDEARTLHRYRQN